MRNRLKTAVMISGNGSTLRNLLACRESGELPIDIALVISSRAEARGLRVAAGAGIPTAVVDPGDFTMPGRTGETLYRWADMSNEIDKLLLPGKFDLVCMAGYLARYLIPPELYGKVINIHPSLIPMFCGDGMFGMRVHRAVVEAGVKITGCTVHIANNEYDSGPIILQRACPVYCHDSPETVAERVFVEECEAYPAAIRLFAEGRVHMSGRSRVFIDDEGRDDE